MIIFARFIVISLHSGPVILNDGLIIVVFSALENKDEILGSILSLAATHLLCPIPDWSNFSFGLIASVIP